MDKEGKDMCKKISMDENFLADRSPSFLIDGHMVKGGGFAAHRLILEVSPCNTPFFLNIFVGFLDIRT